jgi:hypothetical protein
VRRERPGHPAPAHREPRATGAQPDRIKPCRAQPQLSPKGQDVKLGPNRAGHPPTIRRATPPIDRSP